MTDIGRYVYMWLAILLGFTAISVSVANIVKIKKEEQSMKIKDSEKMLECITKLEDHYSDYPLNILPESYFNRHNSDCPFCEEFRTWPEIRKRSDVYLPTAPSCGGCPWYIFEGHSCIESADSFMQQNTEQRLDRLDRWKQFILKSRTANFTIEQEDWTKAEGVISEGYTNSALAPRDYDKRCITKLITIVHGYHIWWCTTHHQPQTHCQRYRTANLAYAKE